MTRILVAIDLVGGEVVRLTKGRMDAKTVYGADPVRAALGWQAAGARWLHLVDLDGATGTGVSNAGPIRQILQAVEVPVQIGGGIRSMASIEGWVDAGVTRICIGTRSMDRKFMAGAVKEFGDRLIASLDTSKGMVRVAGWTQASPTTVLQAIRQLLDCGVSRIMFTDIERDGTLSGPNIDAIRQVMQAVDIPVIAAGGVTDLSDVSRLAGLGLEGIVIGKALYSGNLDLAAAQEILGAG